MNDQASPAARHGDDGGSSPKRKKVRQKYAPRACVSCRRSKLKCSGENPCHRCTENGRRCFYTEDQTAAEALQNLSRPTPVQTPLGTLGANGNSNGNGNGMNRRNILPRHDTVERRASDASLMGLSMEARMLRMEGLMESFMQERGATVTPRMSMERDDSIGESFQSDFTMLGASEASFPNFTNGRQASFQAESLPTVCVGSRSFPFPNPTDYQKSVDFFFADLTHYYHCLNEADFRMKSEKMLAGRQIPPVHSSFLALNYMVLACVNIALETQATLHCKPSGWQWFQAADDLVGKKLMAGHSDFNLIQYLILKSAYLVSADEPNAAYNAIGTACRLCFQSGLHQQSSWRNHTPFEIHMRQRVFWTVYLLDKTISLSCGRPYCIRDSDIDIEQPAYIVDKDVHPDHPLPDINMGDSSMAFLNPMVVWGGLAADVWNGHFAASTAKHGIEEEEHAQLLDSRIKEWMEAVLPKVKLYPPFYLDDSPQEPRHLHQYLLFHNRLKQLRLLLFRQTMLSLSFNDECGRVCGTMAVDMVEEIHEHAERLIPSKSFRFSTTAGLASALLILCTLLVSNLSGSCFPSIDLRRRLKQYFECFQIARKILYDLSQHLALARRVLNDFKDVIHVVLAVAQEMQPDKLFPAHLVPHNIRDLFPYTELDFAHQAGGKNMEMWNETDVGAVQTNGEEWGLEMGGRGARYGVPWI